MKRVQPPSPTTVVPRRSLGLGSQRSLVATTQLSDRESRRFTSGCLGCPDEPCIRFDSVEVAVSARIESPYSPDPSVCPTGAISRGADGQARVDADACIACGLCVVRCPVGAILIDLEIGAARVVSPDADSYESREMSLHEFLSQRASIAELLTPEHPPFADAEVVSVQVERASPFVASLSGQHVLRLLARNAFLLGGAAARLKIVGDNNAACELLVDDGRYLLLIEVEPSADALDAMRRVLAGCAIVVARYGVDLGSVTAALVLHRLPNKRVDYYSVVADVKARLGVTTITIPSAALLLSIRAGGSDLALLREDLVEIGEPSGAGAITARFGPISDPGRAGLVPPK